MRRAVVGTIALAMVAGSLSVSRAHELDSCGGATMKSFSHSYNFPDGWPQGMKDAVRMSAENMTNNSHYNWNKVNSNAEVPWKDLGSSDTSIAGRTTWLAWCGTSPKKITDVNAYMNFSHFDATTHSLERKRCTAIHEFGHAAAFGHNNLGSGSILHDGHNWRCHEVLVYTIQTHDNNDINAKY
jgi:hypothetical protein